MTHSYKDERLSEFREKARQIVRDDRWKRKLGQSVDTAGSIARALEQAYQRGRKDERVGEPQVQGPPSGGVLWDLIPPKSREAFRWICKIALGDTLPFPEAKGCLVKVEQPFRPKIRWSLAGPCMATYHQHQDTFSWGPRTISPLMNLGLLYEDPERGFLLLTEKAFKTWEDSEERSAL